MTIHDKTRQAVHHLFASGFSLVSCLLAVAIGTGFLGLLLSLAIGVSQFFESYYTRTMSLTTLLAFYAPESGDVKPFDAVSGTPGVLEGRGNRLGVTPTPFEDSGRATRGSSSH